MKDAVYLSQMLVGDGQKGEAARLASGSWQFAEVKEKAVVFATSQDTCKRREKFTYGRCVPVGEGTRQSHVAPGRGRSDIS